MTAWDLSEDELRRAIGWDVDARYAYAINKIREHGELWTLRSEDGWVVSSNSAGEAGIPIWPHAQLAKLEATGSWSDAEPDRVDLMGDWLTDARASWFEENDARVSVFMVGTSSMDVDFDHLAELLRGERRSRYSVNRSSGVARAPKRRTRETKDLVSYLEQKDVDLVLDRIPAEFRVRIQNVFLRRSSDAKTLGCVTSRGRREIELATKLPIRVSLRGYLHGRQSAAEFGAPARGQWPPWAVRRFLLYDVLLHEIGHLQVVEPTASRTERKFASETRAQEFADELRRTLYSDHFEHRDPIHNAPTAAELSTLEVWSRLDKRLRAQVANDVLFPRRMQNADMAVFEPLTVEQRSFLLSVFGARARRG